MSATGSSPRRSRSQSTCMSHEASPTHRSSKRAFSAATSPRNTGPREKRARKDHSPSPRSSPPTTPRKLFDEPSAPMSSPLTTLFTNLVSSAPATPLLPSSSSSFFPAVSLSTSHNSSYIQPSLTSSPQHSRAMLDNLHREAFTSLRHSLAQSGEGFLRRMRDWEERRNAESSKASMFGSQKMGGDRRRIRRRGTSRTVNHSIGGTSETHPRDNVCSFPSADISHTVRLPGHMSSFGTLINAHDDSDIENDMLIDDVGDSLTPSERKLHSGSLGTPPIDISNSQGLFTMELAKTDAYPSAHYTSSLEFPFTYSNSRSSSPFSFDNTSDEEFSSSSPYDQAHSGFSSPVMSNSVDRSSHARSTLKKLGENIHHSSPYTSPCPSSLGFSCSPLATRHHKSVQSLDDASTYMHPRVVAVSDTSSQVTQTPSDKALAALVLALANGSGSLADYGSVREAQGELEELEAGDLWE